MEDFIIKKLILFKEFAKVNTYILGELKSKEACVIDPGCANQDEEEELLNTIKDLGLKVSKIINTHGHADHIAGNKFLKNVFNASILIHGEDFKFLKDPKLNMSYFFDQTLISPDADILLKDEDIVKVGDLKLKVIHTPGHSPGSISLFLNGVLFSGDTLFKESVGAVSFEGLDFPFANFEEEINSIKNKILLLDDSVKVLPGHLDETTIKDEKIKNPYINDRL